MFVLLGEKGIDIYEVDMTKHNLIKVNSFYHDLLKNIKDESANTEINIERVVLNSGVLVVLDRNHGLFFYNATEIKTLSDSKKSK